jgi:hypothetical protein
MNTEDSEFERIEREALRRAAFQRKVDNAMRIAFEAAWDDDDTQVYAKPWVGLTDEEKSDIWCVVTNRDFVTEDTHVYADAIEAALRSKNT